MSTPPTANDNSGITFTKTKIFEIEDNNDKFKLKLSNNEKLIFFLIEKENLFPKKEFSIYLSLEELSKINKFFNQFENLSEVFSSLEILLQSKNISILPEEKNMKIKIINPANNKEFFLNVPLKEKDLKSEIDSLIPFITSLNETINDLKNKVNDLEKKVNTLNDLKNKVNDLEKKVNTLNDLKNQVNSLEKKDDILSFKFNNNQIIKVKNEKLILSWFDKKPSKFNLLLDSKVDGDSIEVFYNKCQNKSPTFIIIKTTQGTIFGGYTCFFWKKDSKWYRDDKSFIFSVDKEKKYYPKNTNDHIFGCNSFFQFGNDIRIYDKCTSSSQNFVGVACYNSPENYEMNDRTKNFIVSIYEVYQVEY